MPHDHKRDTRTTNLARGLRRNQTNAETMLWMHLRNRQLAGAKFRRQVPNGPYILDFYCFDHQICVELDGSQHSEIENAARDLERDAYLRSHGIQVLRFPNHEVVKNIEGVLFEIVKAMFDGEAAARHVFGG